MGVFAGIYIEMSTAKIGIPYLFKSILCLKNRNMTETKKKSLLVWNWNRIREFFVLSLLGREKEGDGYDLNN